VQDGCAEAAIEDTKLSDEPKVALVDLIVERHQNVTAAASATTAAAGAAAAAAEAAAAAAAEMISVAQDARAVKLEEMAERYRSMEVRALLPEAKAAPSIDDAGIEAALAEEAPQPRLVQLLVEAAPAMLLAEAAENAGNSTLHSSSPNDTLSFSCFGVQLRIGSTATETNCSVVYAWRLFLTDSRRC
jgi:hypothetical protein